MEYQKETNNHTEIKAVNINRYRGGHYESELRLQSYDDSDNDHIAINGCKKLERAKRIDNFEINHLPKLVKKHRDNITYDGDKCCFNLGKTKVTYYPRANSTNVRGQWVGGLKSFITAIESVSFQDIEDGLISKRFLDFIDKRYKCKNTYDKNFSWIPETSGVYIFVTFDPNSKSKRIVYVGSSNNLFKRYMSHSIPHRITMTFPKTYPMFYFLEMKKGYYDYEMKLIRKLKPIFNKLTYGG